MTRNTPPTLTAALIAIAVSASLALPAAASDTKAPAQDMQADAKLSALAIPLGPPQASVPTSVPVDRNAFPAEIIARMRAALIARADDPASIPGKND